MHFSWDRSDIWVSSVFLIGVLGSALAESFWPFRNQAFSTLRRWIANGLLYATSNVVLVLAYRFSGVALALAMQSSGRGLFNYTHLPYAVSFAGGILVIDFLSYATHRMNHALPFLWRFHQVHHSDSDLDVTTGIRFHPVEGLFTHGTPLAAIALFGIPPAAVLAANIALVTQNCFAHANLRIPAALDRVLRRVIVTPLLHRRHHSSRHSDQNTNFGTIFSFWDHIFGTLRRPEFGELPAYGLAEVPEGSKLNVFRLLALPFRRAPRPAEELSRTADASSG